MGGGFRRQSPEGGAPTTDFGIDLPLLTDFGADPSLPPSPELEFLNKQNGNQVKGTELTKTVKEVVDMESVIDDDNSFNSFEDNAYLRGG
ncbi:hypothetical protein F0562_001382 [Nyssa sinensis]|uniref:Uncharacterized protein n=1 Tax=Nyssa sinensis TaxID=561372 RepID=A0A5J5C6L3_9ASTE|nr:hypothetical protein F0562_001382 [Nyssa sinensis]